MWLYSYLIVDRFKRVIWEVVAQTWRIKMSRYREVELPPDLTGRIKVVRSYRGTPAIVKHRKGGIMSGEIHVPQEPNSRRFMLVDPKVGGDRAHILYEDLISLLVKTVPHPSIEYTTTRTPRRSVRIELVSQDSLDSSYTCR